jgi:hypothetical protein
MACPVGNCWTDRSGSITLLRESARGVGACLGLTVSQLDLPFQHGHRSQGSRFETPRSFDLDPSGKYLLAAGEASGKQPGDG